MKARVASFRSSYTRESQLLCPYSCRRQESGYFPAPMFDNVAVLSLGVRSKASFRQISESGRYYLIKTRQLD